MELGLEEIKQAVADMVSAGRVYQDALNTAVRGCVDSTTMSLEHKTSGAPLKSFDFPCHTLELDEWPYAKFRFTHTLTTDVGLKWLLASMDACLAQAKPYGMLFLDTHNAAHPMLSGFNENIKCLRGIATWIKTRTSDSKLYLAGTGVVIVGDVVTGLLNTLMTFKPPTRPFAICKDEAEAHTRVKDYYTTHTTIEPSP